MKQATQQYKNKIPAYWLIQLLSIMFLLNVVQCKCSPKAEDPKLGLEVKENNLVGNNKTTEATLTNSKAETTADLSQYGLLAEITEGKGKVKCGTTELTIGTAQPLNELLGSDELGKESKNFDLTLEPDAGVTEFEIALAVVELDDSNKTVGESVTVKWRVGVQLSIDTSASTLSVKGSDKAIIEIKNDGTDPTAEDEVVLVIQRTTGDADLDHASIGGTGFSKLETGAAGDQVEVKLKAITKGTNQTVEIPITTGANGTPTDFDVSLKYKTAPLPGATAQIQWKDKDVKLSIDSTASTLSVKGSGNKATIEIKNTGNDPTVEDDVVLVIQRTTGDAQLDHASIGGTGFSKLETGAAGDQVEVKLKAITKGTNQTVEIPITAGTTDTDFHVSLKYKTAPLPGAKAQIQWKDKDVQLSIDTSASTLSVKGSGKAIIEIKNTGNDPTVEDDVVLVIQRTTGDAQLDHNNIKVGSRTITPTGATGGKVEVKLKAITKGANRKVEIPITAGTIDTDFDVSLKYKTASVYTAQIKWKDKDVKLSIDTSTSTLSVKGSDKATIEIKNTGNDPTVDDDVVLVIQRTTGDAQLDHANIKVDSNTITPTGATGDKVEVKLKAITNVANRKVEIPITAGTTDTDFDVSLKYKTASVYTAQIKWKDKDVKLSIDTSTSTLSVKGSDKAIIEIKNTGNDPTVDDDVVLVIQRTTGDADLDHANIKVDSNTITPTGATGDKVEVKLKAITKGTNQTVEIPITAGTTDTDFHVSLQYKTASVDTAQIQWKDKDVQLSIDSTASTLSVKGSDKAIIEIKNTGNDPTVDDEVVLVIQRTTGDAQLDHANIKVDSNTITPTGATGDKVEVKLKAITKGANRKVEIPITAGTTDTDFHVSLKYKTASVATEQIQWKDKDVQLSIDSTASTLSVKGSDKAIIEIKNTGNDPTVDDEVVLVIQRTTGDADLDHASIKVDSNTITPTGAAGDQVEVKLKAITKGTNQTVEIPITAGTTDTDFHVSLQYKTASVDTAQIHVEISTP